MTQQHTPGPWQRLWSAIGAARRNAEERHEKARLIASAPELLDALKGCVEFFLNDPNRAGDGWMTAACREARAAIAKAEGTS